MRKSVRKKQAKILDDNRLSEEKVDKLGTARW